jgi:4-carboxymuconolactone decarboxylase
MKRDLPFGRARALVYISIFAVASVVWVAHAQQQTPAAGQASNFTGGPVTTLKGEGRISYYVFGPGARTKWHTHEGGQLLLAEEGTGRTQERGRPVQDLRPGESRFSPPGVTHWHGSAPGQSAKMYQISRGQTTWLEEVSDNDYRSTPTR